jgi:hypothetical protein
LLGPPFHLLAFQNSGRDRARKKIIEDWQIGMAALSRRPSRFKQIGGTVFEVIGVNNFDNLASGSNGGTCGEAITGRYALILSHAIFLLVNHFRLRISGRDERGFAGKTRLANGGFLEGYGNSTVVCLWHYCCYC